MPNKLKINDFINRSNKIHNYKYNYNLVEYINSYTKVKIICPIHGVFEQRPNDHLKNHGCSKCSNNNSYNIKEFINKSNIIHKNKYDYTLSKYNGNKVKLQIICPIHGIFTQSPNSHLSGQGCPSCYGNKKMTKDIFIKKSEFIHKNKYDYSMVDYKNNYTKVKIICKEHNFIFEQKPNNHLGLGQGCPLCGNKIRRIKRIEQIKNNLLDGYQLIPNFNKNACKIFDEISLKENIHIQHAMNGGELYIKELGYWLDGYDKENNVVYEFDEKYHNYKKGQKEKDAIRQDEIENFLNTKIIRIKNNHFYGKIFN